MCWFIAEGPSQRRTDGEIHLQYRWWRQKVTHAEPDTVEVFFFFIIQRESFLSTVANELQSEN